MIDFEISIEDDTHIWFYVPYEDAVQRIRRYNRGDVSKKDFQQVQGALMAFWYIKEAEL